MDTDDIISQVLHTWRVHNRINLCLLEEIPQAGFGALPAGSRGRTVAEQFAHMNRVRLHWLQYHASGKNPHLPRVQKYARVSRAQLKAAFRKSGEAVENLLRSSLAEGGGRIRLFTREPVRWMGYLISHESHHRGQIALALKQKGMRLPRKVATQGLWEKWYWGE